MPSRCTRLTLWIALTLPVAAARGADYDDPFGTSKLRPATPSTFWSGPSTACASSVRVPDPLRLADAIDIALCNNPQTRQSWANAKAAAAQVGIARSTYLPNLTAGTSVLRTETWNTPTSGGANELTASLTFNYLLFDFGGRDATLELARQSLLAADWAHNANLQTVLLNSVQAYYLLYATQEAVQANLAAEKASLASLDASKARLRVGSATRADMLQAQTAYSQAQLNRTQIEGDAATARGVLANALGLSAEQPLHIAPPPDLEARTVGEEAVRQLIELARSRRPDLAAAEAQVRAAQSNVTIQESAGKPSVSLFGAAGLIQSNPGFDPRTGAVGLQVNVPLFTGFQIQYQILQARELVELQQATRDKLATDVSLDVWRAYQDLRTQGQSLTTANELVASAQESYNVTLARYKAGVGAITDLLNAQSALASANLQQIQARYRWNVAKATLAKAIGVLEPELVSQRTPSDNTPKSR